VSNEKGVEKDVIFGALEAALAAECAGEQDKFVQVHSPLFRDQAGWRNADDPNAFFSTLAGQEGLDVERFDRCIEEGWREERIGQNNRLGQQIGAYGTPLFLVDGRQIPGALPLAEFRTILDASLVRRGVTPPGGG
jgi:protein-disulfide isomerase